MSRLPDDSSASPVTVERPGWLAPVEWAAMTAASALWLVLAARLVGTETTSFRFWWLAVGVALSQLVGPPE